MSLVVIEEFILVIKMLNVVFIVHNFEICLLMSFGKCSTVKGLNSFQIKPGSFRP